jgi:hypothetical protein
MEILLARTSVLRAEEKEMTTKGKKRGPLDLTN